MIDHTIDNDEGFSIYIKDGNFNRETISELHKKYGIIFNVYTCQAIMVKPTLNQNIYNIVIGKENNGKITFNKDGNGKWLNTFADCYIDGFICELQTAKRMIDNKRIF